MSGRKPSLSGLPELAMLAVIFIYPVASVFQGIDFSDMGFLLSKYAFAFNPDVLTFSFGWGLTELLGGLVWLAGGSSLALVFKLAFAVVTLATVCLVWRLLREHLSGATLQAGLAVAMLIVAADMQWLNYYNLTALSFVAAVYALVRAAWDNAGRWYFLAALFLGLATFVRIPNALAVPAILYPLLANRKKGTWLPSVGMAFLGFCVAAGIMLGALIISGQLTSYVDQIAQLFNAMLTSKTHGLSNLLPRQVYDLFKVLLMLILLLAPLFFARRAKRGAFALGMLVLPHVLLAATYIVLRTDNTIINVEFFPVYYGMAFAAMAFIAGWRLVRDRKLRALALLAIFFTLVTYQGSNRLITAGMYGFWLLLPLAVAFYRAFLRSCPALTDMRRAAMVLLMPAFVIAIFFASTYMFRESGDRTRMFAAVSDPKLQGLLTTSPRARVASGLLVCVRGLAGQYRSLLQCNDLPLLHYLLDLPPYAGILWYQCEAESEIARRLSDRSWIAKQGYPLVVRHTALSEDMSWPELDRDGGRAVRKRRGDAARRDLLLAFSREHGYRVIWTDGYFEVLVPPGEKEPAGGLGR